MDCVNRGRGGGGGGLNIGGDPVIRDLEFTNSGTE